MQVACPLRLRHELRRRDNIIGALRLKRGNRGFMALNSITTIAFDADDTLWQNEQFFRLTQEKFASLLSEFADSDHLSERLLEAERRNLGHYGFGIKAFVLSMIETAIEVTEQRVSAAVISELISAGQDMLAHPIELLPHARETVERLSVNYKILLITKGDLLDQERKLAQSGLGDLFDGVEIVSEKTRAYICGDFSETISTPSKRSPSPDWASFRS